MRGPPGLDLIIDLQSSLVTLSTSVRASSRGEDFGSWVWRTVAFGRSSMMMETALVVLGRPAAVMSFVNWGWKPATMPYTGSIDERACRQGRAGRHELSGEWTGNCRYQSSGTWQTNLAKVRNLVGHMISDDGHRDIVSVARQWGVLIHLQRQCAWGP